MKTLKKIPENKQSNLIANVKTPNIGFINKYIINSRIRGGGYSVLVNYHIVTSLKYLSISPSPNYFFYKI